MKSFGKIFHIQKKFSFVYYPQGNGQVEASNKIIKSILSKIWYKYKRDWLKNCHMHFGHIGPMLEQLQY